VTRYLELCTLGDLLVRGSEHHPGRDALVLPGVRLTYRELEDRAIQVARSLTAIGVTRGDRVGLFMPNGPEFIESLFGILFTRAVAIPVNARSTARELRHVLRDAGLRVLLASDAAGQPRTRASVIANALGPAQTAGPLGMTGLPRLVAAAAPDLAAVVALGPAPALELIKAEHVTAMFPAFPPLTLGMLNCPDYGPDSFARVRTVFTVAPPEALRAMQRRMPHSVLVNAYGMTEFGGSVVMVDPGDDDDARLATQGPPFPRHRDRHQGRGRPAGAGRGARRDRHPRPQQVRLLPRRPGQLQGAAARALRHRVADVLDQGADLQAA
jgi:acyl-CoA synthetase (AMP-forming)/AMP-acid ligase II